VGISKGRHRAKKQRRGPAAVGVAGVAVAASALLGMTPALDGAPVLAAAAKAFWVPGTNIGAVPPDDVYAAFADEVIDQTAGPHDPATKVGYPAGFWPLSKGFLSDPTYNASVRTGLANLHTVADGEDGVIIYGYSQGAVVATLYKREVSAVGNTYVLVSNPNRPNGGILQRFNGVTIPIVDVSFNGATPVGGDTTYDIARQYDGWSDFPRYPLNLLATANALLGIVYLHGKYHSDIDPAVLEDPEQTDKQVHGSTTYYLIHTDLLPILMPLAGVLPEPLLKALDAPLRVLVELGYDRMDYSNAVGAGLLPAVNPISVVTDLAAAAGKSVDILRDAATPAQTSHPAAVQTFARTAGVDQETDSPAPTHHEAPSPELAEPNADDGSSDVVRDDADHTDQPQKDPEPVAAEDKSSDEDAEDETAQEHVDLTPHSSANNAGITDDIGSHALGTDSGEHTDTDTEKTSTNASADAAS